MNKIRTHFVLTCCSILYLGIGSTIQSFGIRAGLGFWTTIIISLSSIVLYIICMFTSMQKVKDALKEWEQNRQAMKPSKNNNQ